MSVGNNTKGEEAVDDTDEVKGEGGDEEEEGLESNVNKTDSTKKPGAENSPGFNEWLDYTRRNVGTTCHASGGTLLLGMILVMGSTIFLP